MVVEDPTVVPTEAAADDESVLLALAPDERRRPEVSLKPETMLFVL